MSTPEIGHLIVDVAHIEARLAAISGSRYDPEIAHVMEDTLHRDVLQAIADGYAKDPEACAAAALRSVDIKYERWFA
jgi:hypothetical protein